RSGQRARAGGPCRNSHDGTEESGTRFTIGPPNLIGSAAPREGKDRNHTGQLVRYVGRTTENYRRRRRLLGFNHDSRRAVNGRLISINHAIFYSYSSYFRQNNLDCRVYGLAPGPAFDSRLGGSPFEKITTTHSNAD